MTTETTGGFVFGEETAELPYQCVCGERFRNPGQLGNHVRHTPGHYPRRKWDEKDSLARACTRMKARVVGLPGFPLLEALLGLSVERPIVTPPMTGRTSTGGSGDGSGSTPGPSGRLAATLFDKPAEIAVTVAGLLLGVQFLCAPDAIGKAIMTLLATAYGVEGAGLIGASARTTLGNSLPKRYRDLASSKKLRDDIHYFVGALVAGVVLRYANLNLAITARLGIDQYLPGCETTFLSWPDVIGAMI